MFTPESLIAELATASLALDEAQRRIDHNRNTFINKFRPGRSMLDSQQSNLDVKRMRVDAAMQYMLNRKP
jgi:outer membrane protein TolC